VVISGRFLAPFRGLATSLTLMEPIWPSCQYLLVDGRQATGAIAAQEDFEAVFREHFAPVYRFIAQRVGKALAEDLAAEVFVTAYRRRAMAGLAPVTIAVVAGAFRDMPSEDVPDASSTTRIVQQVGGSFGAAILAVILASALLSHRAVTPAARGMAFDTAFWCAIGLTAVALLPAGFLPAARKPPRTAKDVSPSRRAS
jgi:hypothetical protein